jgi:eukaryotic-like serine/threonine-protein kinase
LVRMKRDPNLPLDAATALEVAQREGGKAVVEGEISPVGKGYVLSAKLVTPDGGTVLVALRETAEDDGAIIPAIDRLSGKLRERIGESLRSIRGNEPLEQVSTGSLEALRVYSQAVRASNRGEYEQSATLLQEAVGLDSGFAMAYRKLSAVLSNSFADRTLVIAASSRAYEHRDRLPRLERHLVTADYYSNVNYDQDRIIAAYRAALEEDPEDPIALNNLAIQLSLRRQWAEAESLLIRADRADPSWGTTNNLVEARFALGRVEEARATLEAFAAKSPNSARAEPMRGALASAVGAYDSARAHFVAMGRSSELSLQQGAAYSLFAVNQVQGKLREAEQQLGSFQGLAQKRGSPGAALFAAALLAEFELLYRKAPSRAAQQLDAAVKKYPLTSIQPLDRPYNELARIYANAGQPERARRLLADYQNAVPEEVRRSDASRHGAVAAIAMAEGRTQEAIGELRAGYDESGCSNCALFYLGRAYEAANQPDSAIAAYGRAISAPGVFRIYDQSETLAQTYLRLGELYEARGEKDKAVENYSRFADLWKDADPELQPQVKDVKERMAKLVGER